MFHNRQILIEFLLLIIFFPSGVFAFTDESHFSTTFNEVRFFRVFTPPDYNPANRNKRYPIIYYFHGCGGSYRKSGTYSYKDYELTAPVAIGKDYEPDYDFPNNADFENFVYYNDVIIICVDGKIEGLPDCGVYFPSEVKDWKGKYYNFSLYIRELIEVVDSRYNTKTGPQFRAVSGLSMGGQMATWIAAMNPHLFSSASQFCHAPNFYTVGDPEYATTIDLQQLWRNLRGVPFRHTTTTGDYIKYYTRELYLAYEGAGFDNEYFCADFCNHHAARIDLQFNFHMNHFASEKTEVPCFSFINLYPDFEVWDYQVASDKKGEGWIYLRNVTKNGLGIYTRKQLPWGKSLPCFDISVTTPPLYTPDGLYTISRYSYSDNKFSTGQVRADALGKLILTSAGGQGEEIGISGKGLQPPVFILTDTVNENIYLEENRITPLSFHLINLSDLPQTVDLKASGENHYNLIFIKDSSRITIPAMSKMSADTLFILKGICPEPDQNRAFIKVVMVTDGIIHDREHIIPVIIKNQTVDSEILKVKIFDGKAEQLPLFKYGWHEWDMPYSSGIISEGTGNGNGKAETGEVFSIWISLESAYDSLDNMTWHPSIPVNTSNNPDVTFEGINYHVFSTGRAVLSAGIKLNRQPCADNPVIIPVRTELLKTEPLFHHCHRPVIDAFTYAYYNIVIYEDGNAEIFRH